MSFLLILNPASGDVTATIATTDAADVSSIVAGHGPNATSATTDAADISSITCIVGDASPPPAAGGGITVGSYPARRFPRIPPAVEPPPTPRLIVGAIDCVDAADICNAIGTVTPPDFDADLELLMLVGAI